MKSQFKSLTWTTAIAAAFIFIGAAHVQAQSPNSYRGNFAKSAPKSFNVRGPNAAAAATANANSTINNNYYINPTYSQYGTNPYSTYPNQYGSYPSQYGNYPNQYSNGYPGAYNGYNSGFNPYSMNPYGSVPYGYYRGY